MECAVRLHWIAINLTMIWILAKAEVVCKRGNVSVSHASLIPLGSTITVSCSLLPGEGCRKHPSHLKIYQRNENLLLMQKHNQTSVSLEIKDVGKSTFTCYLNCNPNSEDKILICGIYIEVGTPPDQPKNLACDQPGGQAHIVCTWDKGRNSYIKTTYLLELKNETDSFSSTFSGYWNNLSSGSLPLPASMVPASNYTALVTASNSLGTAVSAPLPVTFFDVVKPQPPSRLSVEFCSVLSTSCSVRWEDEEDARCFHLRYRPADQDSWSVVLVGNTRRHDLYDLEPFTNYEFQISSKFHITKGIWSAWSSSHFKQSPEAVPVGELDIWYVLDNVDSNTRTITLLWKNMSSSEARGKILHYKVTFENPNQKSSWVWSNFTTQTWFVKTIDRAVCKITVSAYNARGNSPPVAVSIAGEHVPGLPSPRNAQAAAMGNGSLSITWDPPNKVLDPVTAYVVEWAELPKKARHNLNWIKVPKNKRSALIAGNIKPHWCYYICVYALSEKGAGMASCTRGFTRQAAPLSGPQISWQQRKENSVSISWEEIPANQQMGCIINYKLYLQKQNSDSVPKVFEIHGETFTQPYVVESIPAGIPCNIWMTGSTEEGESPRGNEKLIFLNVGSVFQWYVNIILAAAFSFTGFACIYFVQPARQRFFSLFTTHMKIPDPAHSTWAREYKSMKDKMRLHSEQFLNDSSTLEEHETMEIEEVFGDQEPLTFEYMATLGSDERKAKVSLQTPEGKCQPRELSTTADDGFIYRHQIPCLYRTLVSEQLLGLQTVLEPGIQPAEAAAIDYLPTNIISSSINTTEDSSESKSEFCSITSFLPPLFTYGGKLTLDAVKIDCSSYTE
ncbi:interleukin-12 receptor subunit beta-2 isoform X2 [Rhinatrema bivittatum]|uniref:interleukin-12 receptor subunit beta-2 isoform X2 n=1 Tax=Rhinatrema bivittatum TaxID=194408 RepID=UPI0011287CC2|nr:interleukin-12 receptor subunit beta-2 isoform X2 [Rhinatrema bivittatum]